MKLYDFECMTFILEYVLHSWIFLGFYIKSVLFECIDLVYNVNNVSQDEKFLLALSARLSDFFLELGYQSY